jgi:hypothetical protein
MNRKAGFSTNDQILFGPMGIAATDEATYIAWGDSRAGTPEKPLEDAYFTTEIFGQPTTGEGTPRYLWGLAGAASGLAIGGLALIVSMARTRRQGVTAGRAPTATPEPARSQASA